MKKRKKTANPAVKTERITVHIDVDHRTRKLTVKHPSFGVEGEASTEADLRYLLGELNYHLGEYIWNKLNPWTGEEDESSN